MQALLIVAHPGHELRLHGWLERTRPLVLVLTDGSGHTENARLGSTRTVLERTGAQRGSVFGAFRDAALYAALLAGDAAPFLGLRDALLQVILNHTPELVVSDAVEGYNPIHDLCHALVRSACARMESGPHHFDFPLIGPPNGDGEDVAGAQRIVLDDAEFARKLAAIEAYPELLQEARAAFGELEVQGPAFISAPKLVAEVAALRGGTRREDFRTECLRPAAASLPYDGPPFYERYGRALVTAKRYDRAILYREHIAPLLAALQG